MQPNPQQPITLIHQAISTTLGLQKGKKSPLSPIATAILYTAHTKKLQITDIATQFNIKKSTASGYVDNLEKNGYVQRVKDGTDHRVTFVQPTEKSRKMIATQEQILGGYITRHMMNLTSEEREQFLVLLSKFVQEPEKPQ